MSRALHLVVERARERFSGLPIEARVLATNPAVGWYERNGFVPFSFKTDTTTPYVVMKLRPPTDLPEESHD